MNYHDGSSNLPPAPPGYDFGPVRREGRTGCWLIVISSLILTLGIAGVLTWLTVSSPPMPPASGPTLPPAPLADAGDTLAGDTGIAPDAVNLDFLDQPLLAPGDSAGPGLPSESRLKALATNTVVRLGRAIRARDFTAFHAAAAEPLRTEKSPEDLARAFQDFLDKKVDLGPVAAADPLFDHPPAIDAAGRLNLYGHFPLDPPVQFDLQYLWEESKWKVYSLRVTQLPSGTGDAPATRVPDREELGRLARDCILALGRAAKSGDFKPFYDGLSRLWQGQTDPEKLRQAFAVFIERKDLDLASIDELAPALDPDPYIDDNGWLRFSGRFPAKPYPVRFELGFVFEDGGWKPARLKVDL
jgi:hypothetical protein